MRAQNALYMIIVVLILCLVLAFCLYLLRQLRAENQQLRQENHIQKGFFKKLSYDIRTPLHSVSGLAEVISDETLYLSKEEKRNISDQIKYNTSLISTILDEVMEFVVHQSEGHVIDNEELSPNAVCRRCLDSLRGQIEHPGVRAHFKRELSDEFFIRTDSHVLELILNKLICNANRFTKKGEITVGCNTREHVGRLTIYVQDTGGGIPTDRKANMFTWLDNPEDMNDPAEIDLCVAQRMASKIGGFIRLDEQYQQGTRLMLVLPIQ